MGLFKEFREFALKGNVIDLAVGVVIGGAFGKVVSSLVSDIIMPLVGLLTGGISFKDMKWQVTDGVAITYGNFIDTIVNLIIIAAAIFFVIKAMNKIRTLAENALKKQEEVKAEEEKAEAEAEANKLTADQQLLTEIRDLLKARAQEQSK
ncbi:large-conductance mechanosensitive channel [Psittacicella hinzii]|uniref:Large-conductance mechanosensitive channel n=1 Tax=Psittacicella hinzii TaxID=2028575 RepID=A0A3A1Y4L8_9GAMM|nr:large-conductance mechanosensitive channel protein MscL [Psittacicella hinzii]RIY32401.1 large-conductance mechanosensitive channel [Psittacicella hinzii]